MKRSVLDIDDLLADPTARGLAGDARAAMAMSGQPAGYMTELDVLKTQLADSAARSDIECHTIRDAEGWHDLTTAEGEDAEWIKPAVRYLDLRALLERHPGNDQRVRVKA